MERLRAEVSAAHSRKRISGRAAAIQKPLTSWESAFAEVSLPWAVSCLGLMHHPDQPISAPQLIDHTDQS